MAQIQGTILLLCLASVYAASLPNLSDENFSSEIEMEDTPIRLQSNDKNGVITEYDDPVKPGFFDLESNGFQMGKSLAEGILGLLQIVRQMSMSQEGLKNVSYVVANLMSVIAGRYYETLKKFMPVLYGIIAALLGTLG